MLESGQHYMQKSQYEAASIQFRRAVQLDPKFAEAVASGFPRPQVPQLDNFWANFDNALNVVIAKKTDAKAAATEACTKMNTANKIP